MTHAGLSNDTQALMAFETGKKSAGTAYLLWFFLGALGGHRFYLGRTGSAVGQLVLFLLGWATIIVGLGVIFLVALGIWVLVDLFLVGGMVQEQNTALMKRLNVAGPQPSVSPVDELAKFAALRDSGAITEDEYEEQKQRLLGTRKVVDTAPSSTEIAVDAS